MILEIYRKIMNFKSLKFYQKNLHRNWSIYKIWILIILMISNKDFAKNFNNHV